MEERSAREIVNEFRENFKLNNSNDLSIYSDRYILSRLENVSLLFIKQRTDKRELFNSPNIFTPIPCLELKQVPLAECCSYTTPCTISRSVLPLPKIAEGNKFNMAIQGLYSIDGISRKFIESSAERYANYLDLGNRDNQIHYWLQGRYLYISDPNIQKVKLLALFTEDVPEELLYGCGDIPCCPTNPLDLPFKCPTYLYSDVLKETEQEFIKTSLPIKEEKTTGISNK